MHYLEILWFVFILLLGTVWIAKILGATLKRAFLALGAVLLALGGGWAALALFLSL